MNIMELTPLEHLIKRIDHLIEKTIEAERHAALIDARYLATELLVEEKEILEQLKTKNSEIDLLKERIIKLQTP